MLFPLHHHRRPPLCRHYQLLRRRLLRDLARRGLLRLRRGQPCCRAAVGLWTIWTPCWSRVVRRVRSHRSCVRIIWLRETLRRRCEHPPPLAAPRGRRRCRTSCRRLCCRSRPPATGRTSRRRRRLPYWCPTQRLCQRLQRRLCLCCVVRSPSRRRVARASTRRRELPSRQSGVTFPRPPCSQDLTPVGTMVLRGRIQVVAAFCGGGCPHAVLRVVPRTCTRRAAAELRWFKVGASWLSPVQRSRLGSLRERGLAAGIRGQ